MIEVFVTNVTEIAVATEIIQRMNSLDQTAICSFDLEDCDNVFRLETEKVNYRLVNEVFHTCGFECSVMNS